MIVLIIVVGLLVLAALFFWLTYNGLVNKRNAVDNSWAQIEAALQRRHDLIPNLVEAVKGYAKHEQSTFEDVTKARGAAQSASAPPAASAAEGILGAAIGRLMVVAEQYPALRATENFQQLQNQLSETEDQIQITRRVYNDTVQTYNTAIQIFPPNLVANALNYTKRDFFDAPAGSEATPEVSFGGGDAPQGEAPATK
ncbi:MAG: LemA protein [Solirubrobacterales bacterium]|nr:LemA protein [Solirubrobacterales bacterium]